MGEEGEASEMMVRRKFLTALIGALGISAVAQKTSKKFYITGFTGDSVQTANGCILPPIVSYGTDRVDALFNWANNGGMTVWTKEEYEDLKRGRDSGDGCKYTR
jgi:hypothetical protein